MMAQTCRTETPADGAWGKRAGLGLARSRDAVRVPEMNRPQVSRGEYAARVDGMMAEGQNHADPKLVATSPVRWIEFVRRPARSNTPERHLVRGSVAHRRSTAPAAVVVVVVGRVEALGVVAGGGNP